MVTMLVVNFLLAIAMMVLLWLWSIKIRDVSFIDAFWAYGMVLLAAATYLQASQGHEPRKLLLLGLTALWGMRLGTHLLLRWLKMGRDPRYEKILGSVMNKKGWSFAKASLLQVFLFQGPLLFIVCLPAQVGQWSEGSPLGLLAGVGTAIALTGIGFETIADAQLNAFRANPSSKGKVLDTGLWRYTRHPNYFGDACTWWGIWIVTAETQAGLWTFVGPLLVTWLLTRLSGVPMLEKGLSKTRPGYADYVARTSSFFPLPPRK